MIRTIKPTGGGGGGSTPVATELVQGKAQIATSAQTTTGTEAGAYFVTPLRLQDKVDAALVGGVEYKGGYNNTTALPNLTTAKKGDLYIITNKGAGTLAGVAIEVSDHIVFNQDSANPLTSAYFDVIVSSDAVQSVNAATGVVVLDTDDITEGSSNLYYTDTRADGRIGAASVGDLANVASTAPTNNDVLTWDNAGSTWKPLASSSAPVTSVNGATGVVVLDTDDVTEGSSNLYYTDTRADGRIGAASIGDLANVASTAPTNLDVLTWDTVGSTWKPVASSSAPVTSVNAATGVVVLDTDDISEGSSNLYYTDTRADGRIGAASIGDLSNVASTVPTNLDVLTWDTVGSTWKPVASSGGGGGARPVVNVDSSATITVTAPASSILEIIYLCSATTGTQTVDLHTAVGHAGLKYNIKRTGTVNVTVDPNGAETIDGVATFVLTTQYDSVTICSDGTNWVIL